MAWYRNTYECSECGTNWEDEWSCCCDDECPSCSASDYSPVESEDISVLVERDELGRVKISYSHREAGHTPDYRFLAIVENPNLAHLLSKVAYDLAHPR